MRKIEYNEILEFTMDVVNFNPEFMEGKYTSLPDWRRAQFALAYYFAYLLIIATAGCLWLGYSGLRYALDKEFRKSRRPKYYPQENERRRRLASARRKIRNRRTLNKEPTADQLREQYAKIKRNPKEMIRFGSLLCDLEAYVDNSLVRDSHGEIVGRKSGIKGWLAAHCPEMRKHYSSIMRYKAMAEKFRQAVGLADPHPAAEALDEAPEAADKSIFAEAAKIFAASGNTSAALYAELGRRLDPDPDPKKRKKRRRAGRKVFIA